MEAHTGSLFPRKSFSWELIFLEIIFPGTHTPGNHFPGKSDMSTFLGSHLSGKSTLQEVIVPGNLKFLEAEFNIPGSDNSREFKIWS